MKTATAALAPTTSTKSGWRNVAGSNLPPGVTTSDIDDHFGGSRSEREYHGSVTVSVVSGIVVGSVTFDVTFETRDGEDPYQQRRRLRENAEYSSRRDTVHVTVDEKPDCMTSSDAKSKLETRACDGDWEQIVDTEIEGRT